MKRSGITCALLLALALMLVACSGQGEGGSETAAAGDSPSATSSGTVAPVSALSGREKADEVAKGWQQDAKLYSITASPVTAEGMSRSWNYAYVSRSAGAVSIITASDGEVGRGPERQLSEKDLKDVSRHVLPENTGLIDSTEAMKNSDEVGGYIKQHPEAWVSMGLDSFSSERPAWTLTVSQKNLQEKVPAIQSS